MIRIENAKINIFNNMLLIEIPKNTSLELISKAQSEEKPLRVEISTPKKKRSLSANAYCWVLCQEIAEVVSGKGYVLTREDVYKKNIKELFAPTIVPIRNNEVADWLEFWPKRGLGWLIEDIGESKLQGYTRLALWKGSSQFDTKMMSRLIEGLIQEAEQYGLVVMDEADRQLLLDSWETDRKKE